MSKTGIILLNMGGPERLEDVQPFLYNLFSDREIIKLGPAFMQKPLAWYIAKKRAPISKRLYEQIGGGSPLTRITSEQANGLEKSLQQHGDYRVVVAMRYWEPTAKSALKQLESDNIDRIIALPLYPHFSKATSGSSLNDLNKTFERSVLKNKINKIEAITSWAGNQNYIQCLADSVNEKMATFDGEEVQILYSAHSLPTSFIKDGDPYVDHLNKTINGVEALTGITGKLCFQSKSGPVEWLSPSTSDTIKELGEQGCKNILVLPLSFVSDHVETLYEIDIMFRKEAAERGIRLEMTKGLNATPNFIDCLLQLVLSKR